MQGDNVFFCADVYFSVFVNIVFEEEAVPGKHFFSQEQFSSSFGFLTVHVAATDASGRLQVAFVGSVGGLYGHNPACR